MTVLPRADIYFIWRRSDGLISASANRMPQNYKGADGVTTKFRQIGDPAYTWQEAYERIDTARKNQIANGHFEPAQPKVTEGKL